MENRMTNHIKSLALFGLLLALSLTLSAPLFGQRSGSHGGTHMAAGGGSRAFAPRTGSRTSAYTPVYSSYYPGYGFGAPFAYASNPYPDNPNGGPMMIVSSPPGQTETNVVYIPSYMRENNGPSLAEIASQLKTEHQPSKYIWKNVEPQLQAK
jgi:hypothetical protein